MKRTIAMAAACVMLAGLSTIQATAAPSPKPQIEDPLGDANFLNDQGTGDGSFGDVTGADAGTVSDLTAVTLTNDKKNLYVQFQTEAAPPALSGVGYRARFNGAPGSQCLYVEAFFPGGNNDLTAAKAQFRDSCAGGDPVEAQILGTLVVVPRNAHEAFGKGKKLTDVQALTFLWSGSSYPLGADRPVVDTTLVGKDFAFKG